MRATQRRGSVTNSEAVRRTLKALGDSLGEETAALRALAETLARALDHDQGNAALGREYRATLVALMEAADSSGPDDDTQSFLNAIRAPLRPAVGDT